MRPGVLFLIAFLVLTPFLGFAAGEVAHHVWDKHPRHAPPNGADGPHLVWKTTPGTVASGLMSVGSTFVGRLVVEDSHLALAAVLRPFFVPPRV
jgi:hypothetical protein